MAEGKKRIRPDKDIHEMTSAEFARAKPLRAAMPEVVKAMKRERTKRASGIGGGDANRKI